ncbi:hypothetical protein [cf. Phormidesmis sp. LEGE 11477]|uniref:hypothetical protein n=1 Tax=cf. Phormidesmis sp. LEGE 11477 TaxID=1828680 RepID=UPI001882765C|nr:hypothetical protein [cf. Phormidesmis sp. LEGE 11477]MBE9061720.1 hypothetical protein [cf. Phormidesmis sp. LEGE 11477]
MGLEKQLLALPWIDLPDSLETLGNLAVQLQRLITVAISHPIWAVITLLLSIGLIQLAADLVKRTIQASLRFILTLPLMLSQRLWKQITTNPETKQAQINQLLNRLETLRQEQDQVIAELKPLLSSSPAPTASPLPLDESNSSQVPASPTP